MPRRCLALILLATVTLATTAPAGASEPPPRACVAVTPSAPRCHHSATFEQGRPVTLRATTPGTVWRRAPRSGGFVALGRTDRRGQWSWTPLRRHVHPAAPYTFRVTTPAGTSNPVEVWIVPRHG
ncbi:MAG TPA: hypothetical protein VFU85_07610 [Nocardioides sp.]|nr:hypothetical protein [Nocardioides sp.]